MDDPVLDNLTSLHSGWLIYQNAVDQVLRHVIGSNDDGIRVQDLAVFSQLVVHALIDTCEIA